MSTSFLPGLERSARENAEVHLRRVHEALIICTQHSQHGLRLWDADTVRGVLLSIKSFGASLRPLVTHLMAPHLDGVDALPNLQDLTLGTKMSEGFGGLAVLRANNLQPLTGLKAITRLRLANTMVNDMRVLADHTALRVLCLAKCEGVSDLSPLHGLSLQQLDLSYTSVADISPLAHMSSLEVLSLSGCPSLSTLTPHLPGLQELYLERTKVVDIAPLSGTSNLRTLSLAFRVSVEDLAPIAYLHNLHNLNLMHTGLAHGAILSGLSHLRVLKLRCAGVTDLGPLQALQLEELYLGGNIVLDLAPLASLSDSLRHLNVCLCSELENISALTRLTRLKTLHVSPEFCDEVLDVIPDLPLTLTELGLMGIQDLSGLVYLQNLHNLRLVSNFYSPECSIGPLAQLTSLKWLLFRNTPVADLGPLRGLPLERLHCRGTDVTDLSPLAATFTLEQLACDGCSGLLDVSPLRRLSRLSWLDLSDSSVHDLRPLSGLLLQHLFLAKTQVHDLSPLEAVCALVCLDVSNTPVQDLTPLAGLTKLQLLKASGCPAMGVLPSAMIPLLGLEKELDLDTPYPKFASDDLQLELSSGDWLHWDLLVGRDWCLPL